MDPPHLLFRRGTGLAAESKKIHLPPNFEPGSKGDTPMSGTVADLTELAQAGTDGKLGPRKGIKKMEGSERALKGRPV